MSPMVRNRFTISLEFHQPGQRFPASIRRICEQEFARLRSGEVLDAAAQHDLAYRGGIQRVAVRGGVE